MSYLYQAATHLMNARPDRGLGATNLTTSTTATESKFLGPVRSRSTNTKVKTLQTLPTISHASVNEVSTNTLGPSCHLISQLRSVSLKGQIRLSQAMKHSICKSCDALLVPGTTSSTRVENKSRGSKKPWADVLVTTCHSCSATKRFPVGAKRQRRRPHRASDTKLEEKDSNMA